MKRVKAAGLDNIKIEMIAALGDFGLEKITDLCNEIYNTGHIPHDLKTSVFVALPKKSKALEYADYRTISLINHMTKILTQIIQERIKSKIDEEVSQKQFGFRKNCGTREAIFCLRTIIEKYIQIQKSIFVCFIDYSKAFDRIHHEKLIKCLEEIGLDGKDIRIISHLYWEQKATIRSGKNYSSYIDIKRGVRQGCVLSPCLFNIYTEKIFKQMEEMPGLNICGQIINNIRYADDTVLLADNEQELQNLIEQINNRSKMFGLDINIEKTKTMVISKTKEEKSLNIRIDGENLEQVSSFVYLGHIITDDGRCEAEVKKRIGMAKNKFNNMRGILTTRQTTNTQKMRIIKCYIYSALLYGAETWVMNKKLEKNIEAFEMWIYRRIGRVSWKEKKTNKEVLQQLGMKKELLKEIKIRQIKYFGHIKRHDTILKKQY